MKPLWIILLASVCLAQVSSRSTTTRPAATSPDLLGVRLDEEIAELSLTGVALPEALKRLGEVTGTKIVLDESVPEHLPHGAATKLASLNISHASLRDILPQVLTPLALEYKIAKSEIRVQCTPPLYRMEDSATWVELKLLNQLATTPYSADAFGKLVVQYRISAKLDAPVMLGEQMAQAGHGTLGQVLETATHSLGWTWYPDENVVIVLTKQASIARVLSQKADGPFVRRHLGEILFDLGKQAHVHVFLQPGTFKMLPPHVVDSFTIPISDVSIRGALDYIAADTGLAYRVEVDGVHVGPAEDFAKIAQAANGPADDPYVAKAVLPMAGGKGQWEFLLRQSELPADVLALRRKALKDFIQESRSAASRPASQPASQATPNAAGH